MSKTNGLNSISSLYSDKVMKHFQNPHNMGKIENPSGVGRVGNPVCGDLMELQIKIEKRKGKEYIVDAKFQTFGCGAAIASSSMLTDLIIGKNLDEVIKVTDQTVIEALDGLPPVKKHCSVLAEEALQKAINNYWEKQKNKLPCGNLPAGKAGPQSIPAEKFVSKQVFIPVARPRGIQPVENRGEGHVD